MISQLNEVNNKYERMRVLELLNYNPKILNNIVINYFRSKGLYEKHFSKRSPNSGNKLKDWVKGFNDGRYLDLTIDKKGTGPLKYKIVIGFDGSDVHIKISDDKYKIRQFKFSVINLNVKQFLDKIYKKLEYNKYDKDLKDNNTEWNKLKNVIEKKFNSFDIRTREDDDIIKFLFIPDEYNFGDETIKKYIDDIYNPSDWAKETDWKIRETFFDIIRAMNYINLRMKKLGYKFYDYTDSHSSSYLGFYYISNKSNEEPILNYNDVIETVKEKALQYDTKKEFLKNTIKKLFEDDKIHEYWSQK